MRKLIFSAIALTSLLVSQVDPVRSQTYRDMMDDIRINVNDVIKEAEIYFDKHGRGKGSGFKEYARWKHNMEQRFPNGDRSNFNPLQAYQEFKKFQMLYGRNAKVYSMSGSSAAPAGHFWTEMGPDNADDILPTDWNPGVGRVEAMDKDPNDTMIYYLGSRMGGFWKTVNGGISWYCTTQDLPGMGVMDIEVDPDNPNEIWTIARNGTGYSLGLLRSLDAGETWDTTSLSFTTWNYVIMRDLVISSINPDTMYVASNDGLYRSFDGGNTWTLPYAGNVNRIKLKPDEHGTIYILDRDHDKNAIRKSIDAGVTWSDVTISGNSNANAWLATSPDDPLVVYWASNSGIWRSNDSANSFSKMGNAPNSIMDFDVLDTDVDRVISGGLDSYMSTDGGANFFQVLDWLGEPGDTAYVHADAREMKSYNGVFYMGSDGYLGRSRDGGYNWEIVNPRGVSIREYYQIGMSPMRYNHVIGGSQDNGTSVMKDGTWYQWIGADGMECHFDRSNPEIFFGTIQYGALRRTTAGGYNQNNIAPDANGGWVTPSVMDPSNDNTIFIGYDKLYKTMNNGDNWTMVYDFSVFTSDIDYLAIAESDSNVLYLAENKSDNLMRSDDNGANWTNYFSGLATQSMTDVSVHPADPMMVGVTHSGYSAANKVFISDDGGANWTNITSNLPNVPANAIVFEGDMDNRIYVGTDAGVYYYDSTTGGLWVDYNDSLPVIDVRDLEIMRGANRLWAATYGRGAWHAPLINSIDRPMIKTIDMDPNTVSGPNDKDQVHVLAMITDGGTVTDVKLYWGTDAYTFPNVINMVVNGVDSFITSTPIPAHSAGTIINFKIRAEDNSGDTSWSDKIIYKANPAVLCDAEGHSGTGSDYITLVAFSDMTNSGTGQGYYTDYYTSHMASVEVDSSYQLLVDLNTHWAEDSVFAWIDWNNNLTFEEKERIDMSKLNVLHESTGTVTVPSWVTPGDTMRMRVRNIYATSHFADPCGTLWGEVEDYGIYIAPSGLTALFTFSPSAVCEGQSVTFTNTSSGSFTISNWMFYNATDTIPSTMTNPTITFNDTGVYSTRLIISNGSIFDTIQVFNNIDVNVVPVVTANTTATSICAGDSVTLTGSGAASYSWSGGVVDGKPFAPTVTQSYTVTGTTLDGCSDNDAVVVTVNQLPNVILDLFSQDSICETDAPIALPIGFPGGGSYSGLGVVGGTFDPSVAGVGLHTITYSYTDANSCSNSDDASISVVVCQTGINNDPELAGIRISPNPSTGLFQITLNSKDPKTRVTVSNLIGEQIVTGEVNRGETYELDLTHFPDGVYFLRLKTATGWVSRKVVKE
jgi:photosystem II stability/assembly factor-like uncharacterized protein/PKD repeat protein